MKKTLTTYDIADALLADTNASWSRAGAFALADHFEELEQDLGEEFELDVVAIRCDYSEHEGLEQWARDYTGTADFWEQLGIDLESEEDEDKKEEMLRDYIQDHCHLIEFDGGIIVSSF